MSSHTRVNKVLRFSTVLETEIGPVEYSFKLDPDHQQFARLEFAGTELELPDTDGWRSGVGGPNAVYFDVRGWIAKSKRKPLGKGR